MENQISPSHQSSIMSSPKNNIISPTIRHALKEITQNMNTSQISNGDSKLSNATPVLSSNNTLSVTPNLQVSVNKGSDESSDSSLDYGSANEGSANREDSLIHAFNDIHLNTPKADGNNIREKVHFTSLDGSVKFESNNKTISLGSDTSKPEEDSGSTGDSQISESHSSRKQKVFNIVTECFETPDSSFIGDQTVSKENLEIGQDLLNFSTDVGAYNLSIPTIDPILEKSESLRKSPIDDSGIQESESHHARNAINNTFEVYDADGIAVISPGFLKSQNHVDENKLFLSSDHVSTHSIENINEFPNDTEDFSKHVNSEHNKSEIDSNIVTKVVHSLHEDNLDTISGDGIIVLKSDDNEETHNDLNSVPENIVNNLPEISEQSKESCKIPTDLPDESQYFDKTVEICNRSTFSPSQINNSEDAVKVLNESHNNVNKTDASLSTTFEIPTNNDNLNTTYSEPMDCDVSFVTQEVDNLRSTITLNSAGNETNNLTISLDQIQSHVVNQTYDANVDVSEPMDCDEYVETENSNNLQVLTESNIEAVITTDKQHLSSNNICIDTLNEVPVESNKLEKGLDNSESPNNIVVNESLNITSNISDIPIGSVSVSYNAVEKSIIHENVVIPLEKGDKDNCDSAKISIETYEEAISNGHTAVSGFDPSAAINSSFTSSDQKAEVTSDFVVKTDKVIANEITDVVCVSSHSEELREVVNKDKTNEDLNIQNDISSITSSDLKLETTNDSLIRADEALKLITKDNTNAADISSQIELRAADKENKTNDQIFVTAPESVFITQEELLSNQKLEPINSSDSETNVVSTKNIKPLNTALSKISSFDETEVNPFMTKSRILNTPDRDICDTPSGVSVNTVKTPSINTYPSPKKDKTEVEINKNISPKTNMEVEINENPSLETDKKEVETKENIASAKEVKDLPVNVSSISDEEIPPMEFNDAEVISDDIYAESLPNVVKNTSEISRNTVGIAGQSGNITKTFENNNMESLADDCLDEEFKRPLVLQSELMNTDLDGLDSDSDTLSVCSSVNPSDINPFETRCKIANSPERDEDRTLTLNRNELNDNIESALNATLVAQKDDKIEKTSTLPNNSSSYDIEGNVIKSDKKSPKLQESNIHLSETIVISDSPEVTNAFKNSPTFKDHLLRKCEKSPDYNDNTPKTAKPIKKVQEKENKEHNFISPLAHDKRVKELVKRKIADKKVSNLSPMSRCGDLMGLSPVMHSEDEVTNRADQVSSDMFPRDSFFFDDLEEEFKMPANFIKDPLDFLLSCGSNPANQNQCKESLLLKFDPLLSSGRGGLPTGVRPGRETIPESPRLEEDASTASGLAESCSSDSSPLSTSITEGKTFGKMSSMDQSLGAPSPKLVNVTPQQVEKPTQVVTPAISTRQPVTPISSKNNPATPAKSVTSAIAAIDRLISLGGTPPPPPVVVQPKEPEMDPRMLAELQSVRELLARQEEELRKVEEQKQSLETQLADAVSREQTLIDRLNDKTIDRRQMDTVLEEYERTMTQFIGERDVEKRQWEEERAALVRERDEANAHLANMEHSFNDIHAKYERCKAMIQGYKANEESLKETVRSNDEASRKQLERYEHLRQHAMSQLEIANQEIDSVKKASQAEIIKLQAMLKKSEINVTSLQESLAQKTKDIEELTAICDELIQKVG